tara:strand:+ start:33 stop:575 length:543 start_codon:yes stop_codon:yes gene_type:complete
MASIITATTTSGLTQSADNSGVLQLASGTGNLVTVPSVTGTAMVSGNMPAFSAYNSSATSLASGTNTQVLFATEDFDTNNNFASSRFTPTVAGYYQLNSAISIAGGGGATEIIAIIYKNGAVFKSGADGGTASFRTVVSSLVYANGTTDYFEIYCYSGAARTTEASSSATWFNGTLVRAA